MMDYDSLLLDECALALKPVFTGEYQSKIITTNGIYYSKLPPNELLNRACLRYFSTKQGRTQAAALLLKFAHKPPFLIEPGKVGVFPTESSKNPECIWIFNHRFTVDEIAKGKSVITFMNGTSIHVPVSKFTILKQYERLHTLMSISRSMLREKDLYGKNE